MSPLAAFPFLPRSSVRVQPHLWQLHHFRSGTNEAGEIEATYAAGLDPGVAVQELREDALRSLERAAVLSRGAVFVDSGAFSEFVKQEEIEPDEWRRRLAVYARLARAFGPRAFLVAPDKVADQDATVARIGLYRPEVMAILKHKPVLIVALQGGQRDLIDLARLVFAIYDGYAGISWGIPLRKGATSLRDIGQLAKGLLEHPELPRRFHMLGLSPPFQKKQLFSGMHGATVYFDVRAALARHLGDDLPITSDAVRLAALTGSTRPITALQRQGYSRTEAIRLAYEREMAEIRAWQDQETTR